MTREKAIELLESYDFPEESPDLTHAAYMGAEALREELAEDTPLTPDDLRKMDGEPVYLSGRGLNRWDILDRVSADGIACFWKSALSVEDIGKTWLAYRRRLEEVTA